MVESSDKEYQSAKLIKQSRKNIAHEFKNIADWISKKYNVTFINICHELMANMDKIRLGIAVEFGDEYLKFKEEENWWSNYDKKIQDEIAEKYIELNKTLNLKSTKKIFGLIERKEKLKPSDIFVSTSAFEPIAKEEVNTNIPEQRIEKLKLSFDLSQIRTIYRCFGSATLFVFNKK